MKKIIALVLVLALALCCASCGGTKVKTLDDIKKSGKLVVGTSADFAPYEFHIIDDAGNDVIVGFDMALAKAIADDIGVELEIKDMNFDSILMELTSGNIDLGIAGFSPDPERAKTVDFSDLYYLGGQSFAILKANAGKYDSYDDFAGLQVGAQSGSIQADLLAANCPDAQPVLLKTVPDIIMELISGKIEGAFIETAILENYIKQYPEIAEMCAVDYDQEGSAIAIMKGNDTLTAAVNEVIAKVVADGTMDAYVAEANELSSKAIA